MNNLVNKIRKHFDKKEETRGRLLDISHDAIRNSSRAMAALHRREEDEISNLLEEIEQNIQKLNEILASEPQFKEHGSLVAAHREYAEIILTRSIIKNENLPDPEEINVLYKSYAQALAESVGELRRYLLNLLREDKTEKAQNIHERMEEIFDSLEQFDYPDSILPGMKHRRDVARKTLEKTRADITRAIRERKLEKTLDETKRKLGDKN